jgi:hypothetical protein
MFREELMVRRLVMGVVGVVGVLMAAGAVRGEAVAHTVVVRDEGGKAVEGASVRVMRRRGAGATESPPVLMTNGEGKVVLEVPAGSMSMVLVTAKGYLAGRVEALGAGAGDGGLPTEVAVEMDRPVAIGGVVVDGAGKAVAGAEVALSIEKRFANPLQRMRWGPMITATDGEGRWSVEAPAVFEGLSVRVRPSGGLVPDGGAGLRPFAGDLAAVKAGRGVLVAPATVPVEIAVTGPDGKAAAATVGSGERAGLFGVPDVTLKTDGTGKARGAAEPGAALTLLVQAKGAAPELVHVVVRDRPVSVAVALKAAQVLRGQVVDAAGKPVLGARVFVQRWRGSFALTPTLETNEQGDLEWDAAPADAVEAEVTAAGMARAHVTLQAGKVNRVVMVPPTVVTGKVVDAATGAAVPAFVVRMGHGTAGGEVRFEEGADVAGHDGVFAVSFADGDAQQQVRVEAPGYLPAESGILPPDGATHKVELSLKHARAAAGQLVGADGKPAAGVKVYQLFESRSGVFNVVDGTAEDAGLSTTFKTTTTGADGRFTLAGGGAYVLFAQTAEGYLLAEQAVVEKGEPLRMEKFARIEGTLMQGTKRVAGGKVWMTQFAFAPEPLRMHFQISAQATADGAGHFEFERVLAAPVRVGRVMGSGEAAGGQARATPKAGETVRVMVGGTGRPVTGTIALPAGMRPEGFELDTVSLAAEGVMGKSFVFPAEALGLSIEERVKWYQAYYASPAGKAETARLVALQEERPTLFVTADGQGRFRIEDVPAGKYTLAARYISAGDRDRLSQAQVQVDVTVPAGVSDEALELGVVRAEAVPHDGPLPAEAPDFAVTLSDGSAVRLSKLRGKSVLLAFWSAKDGLMADDIAGMQRAAALAKARPGFVLLPINVDGDAALAKKAAAAWGWDFPIAFVGEKEGAALLKAYAFAGPRRVLVGPAGQTQGTGTVEELLGRAEAPMVLK